MNKKKLYKGNLDYCQKCFILLEDKSKKMCLSCREKHRGYAKKSNRGYKEFSSSFDRKTADELDEITERFMRNMYGSTTYTQIYSSNTWNANL